MSQVAVQKCFDGDKRLMLANVKALVDYIQARYRILGEAGMISDYEVSKVRGGARVVRGKIEEAERALVDGDCAYAEARLERAVKEARRLVEILEDKYGDIQVMDMARVLGVVR